MLLNNTFRAITGATAAMIVMAASPAHAGTNAATTQITGAVKSDKDSKIGDGEREFQQLFASWRKIDNGGELAAGPQMKIFVPAGMPVEGVTLTSGYGMRNHPVLHKRAAHKGVDLAGPRGTPVYATADGTVGKAQYFGSYGNYVQIEHGGDLETRYAHLSSYTVNAGEHVKKGELIGYIGTTGRSTGPHLHYEVRVDGEAVDPRPYMITTELAVNENGGGMGGPE
ncbi:peptidoglycan DD-metalloendopeptidase family protein [Altererythrobacter indicus]|uniref:Peptidoglycan DD-metalloendopeptidase family protein n=1 Tax=Altericroceibacterium indicum TaxID=374177 RepID=A0A845AAT4_9SPHN|nr:M23 family metallopeptidase [Altericroceibacterium indicum]MXP26363.1 peptidoglycan DD-metalloendopeptidase family protein [Altericroceibacterium indicum]